MIIDTHAHLGSSRVFDCGINEDSILLSMEKNKVDAILIQILPGAIPNSETAHENIYKLTKKFPKKIFGVASVNPNLPSLEVTSKLEKYINEYGFVAIKLHTVGYSVNPLSKGGTLLFETANKLRVPIIVHTGTGIPFASPSLNMIQAKKYPELKIILAHSGMNVFAQEAYIAAKECSNIFLETSWTSAENIEWFIKDLGSDKVVMGSDIFNNTCYNQTIEINKYNLINIPDKDRNKCLFENANKIFKLNL